MNTEITEHIKEWVFYDGECGFCRACVFGWADKLKERGVGLLPLQAEQARERLGLIVGEPLVEMKLLTSHGEILGGADALIYLARYFWWGGGLRWLAKIPGARFAFRRAYAWFAPRRYCVKGRCKI